MSDDGREERARTVAAIASVALVVLWLLYDAPTEPAAITKTGDSLVATQPAFDSGMTARAQARAVAAAQQRELERRERARRDSADRARATADSVAAAAPAPASTDSVAQAWRAAYEARTAENVQLRDELALKEQRIAQLVADSVRWHEDLLASTARRLAVEKFNADLRVALAKATECRLIGPIRCLTRRESAVGGLLLGLAAHW